MDRIVDWFWNFNAQRPEAWRLAPSGLNAVMRVARQQKAIKVCQENSRNKACVAFWGPSQSGKSSVLSHYIDGDTPEDLALTWNPDEKVYFSFDPNKPMEDCIVFNPYRGGMDASGLVTRFYLPTEDELKDIDPAAPVRVSLAGKKQIMHALAVGYRMECRSSDNPLNLGNLNKMLASRASRPNRDAFELLYDVCDICECMGGEYPMYAVFCRDKSLRQKILSSGYTESIDKALELAAYLLWDGEEVLTDFFNSLLEAKVMFSELLGDADCPAFYVSMEVASLLEDIGIQSAEQSTSQSPRKYKALRSVKVYKSPQGAVVVCNGNKSSLAKGRGESLKIKGIGYLQALIGELRIPLKRPAAAGKSAFFEFLESCDLLDIPGVTNRATATAKGTENLLDLSQDVNETMLLARVYKSGKTLSIVYGQSEQSSIDAFVVFNNLDRTGGLSRPATINGGIRAWLSPFGFTDFDRPLPLKLYVNYSLVGQMISQVAAAANTGGLDAYCDKALELAFASSPYVNNFFTTNRFAPCSDASCLKVLTQDAQFRATFLRGSAEASLKALFEDSYGTDFMFRRLREDVSAHERFLKYTAMLDEGRSLLAEELMRILPSEEDGRAMRLQRAAETVLERVRSGLSENDPDSVERLIRFVKSVFYVSAEHLHEIPPTPHTQHEARLKEYLSAQIRNWVSERREVLSRDACVLDYVHENELYAFLEAVSSVSLTSFTELLKRDFWNHSPTLSRPFLAMALTNAFLYGDWKRAGGTGNQTVYEKMCVPFLKRLETLAAGVVAESGMRPRRIEGDSELSALVEELNIR